MLELVDVSLKRLRPWRVSTVGIDVRCRRCGMTFYICRACWRGHAYCSPICQASARTAAVRAAGRRYEATDAGHLSHRLRQQAYRDRRAGSVATASRRVTHQGTEGGGVDVLAVANDATAPAPADRERSGGLRGAARRPTLPCCSFCGRQIDLLPILAEVRSLRRIEWRRRQT